jgi:hypothetical protein
VPSAKYAAPDPARVLTIALPFSELVTASIAALRLLLIEDNADPQDTTTLERFVAVNEDGSHLIQDETVKAEESVGRLDKTGVDKYVPFEIIKAAFGKEVEFV